MANTTTRTFSDLDGLFGIDPRTKDVALKTDDNAIRGALRNLILTKHFERPFHPEIGCQIHNLLFENDHPTTLLVVERAIRDTITKFEPRVILLAVDVNSLDNNEVTISIEYKIKNTEVPRNFTTTFTRVR